MLIQAYTFILFPLWPFFRILKQSNENHKLLEMDPQKSITISEHNYLNLEKFLPTLLLIFKKISHLHYYWDLHFYLISKQFPSYTIIWANSCIQNSRVSLNELEGGNLEN